VATPILETLLAQDTAKSTLERALARDRVHHAYLFDGPEGVGKERAALGLAQALVCEARPVGGAAACGKCSACVRVVIREGERRPLHPDVVVLERGLYPPEQIGRRSPETQDLSIDQVRALVLARAAFAPHEGRARVFILRRAEELSTGAANALLKTLEEPGARTHFILLSSRADTLLSTIRSRTQRVRFGPLPDAVLEQLLLAGGASAADAKAAAKLSRGSMAVAAALADPEATAERTLFVTEALSALRGGGLGPVLALAEEAKKRKDGLELTLSAFAQALAERSRDEALRQGSAVVDAHRYQVALRAMSQLDGNASAQLVVESMLIQMRGA
jgi:DNA polymerase-3 subunit delta'